jgi:hypothetical protein
MTQRARSCHEQMQQNAVAAARLFDHLVGPAEQSNWKSEAKRFGGLEIEGQFRLPPVILMIFAPG